MAILIYVKQRKGERWRVREREKTKNLGNYGILSTTNQKFPSVSIALRYIIVFKKDDTSASPSVSITPKCMTYRDMYCVSQKTKIIQNLGVTIII